jgi:hypothetical protein
MRDLISLINIHRYEDHQIQTFDTLLKKILKLDLQFNFHYYCIQCRMEIMNNIPTCPMECSLKGRKQDKFIIFNLEQQIQEILKRS